MELFNDDCLEKMKDLKDKSIDLIFCDLPYATKKYSQVSCKWNTPIDLDLFWEQVMRIKKLNTPIFMTCTTKFGVDLINSAPKKCHFRYDIVWCKSAPAGFLSAKKMPMRKHEMVYVFYEKLPFYDLSSHKHKFIKNEEKQIIKGENNTYNTEGRKKEIVREKAGKYDPPLPVSVVKEVESKNNYNNHKVHHYTDENGKRLKEDCNGSKYDPPLPVSVVKQEEMRPIESNHKTIYGDMTIPHHLADDGINRSRYEPPLPNSMLEIKSTRGKHSTEKPVALMEWVLKYYSKEGDTILDPTMGSGSTGVACKNMNRKFIGIEKDEDIFKVAYDRLN